MLALLKIVKVKTRENQYSFIAVLCAPMKQFIAVLFLIAYSLTSIGAPVVIHQCSNKQHPIKHQATPTCGHAIATTMDCCSSNQQQCTVKGDENTTELSIYKEFTPQYPFLSFSFAGEQDKYFIPLSSSLSANSDVQLNIHKLRLYLYKRVLLI